MLCCLSGALTLLRWRRARLPQVLVLEHRLQVGWHTEGRLVKGAKKTDCWLPRSNRARRATRSPGSRHEGCGRCERVARDAHTQFLDGAYCFTE
jgi:hypothetical protein